MILAHESVSDHSVTIGLVVASVVLFWVMWAQGRPRRIASPLAWTAGMLAIAAISLPPVEEAVEGSFAAHMVQHLVLWVVVPPLLVLSHPIRVAERAGIHIGSRRWRSFNARHVALRLGIAWAALVVTMYGTHLTDMYDLALRHQWVHEAEHVAYLASAVLLWSSVLGTGRAVAPARAGLAAAAAAPLVMLGVILSASTLPLYSTYVEHLGPGAALADQRRGAAIMWLGSMVAVVPLIVYSVWRWAQSEHLMQLMVESAEDDRDADRAGAAALHDDAPLHLR